MASAQIDELTAIGHHYCVRTIQLAVQQVVLCGSSLRGVQKTFELYTDSEEIATPSFSSIRKWLGRIGLYELHRKKEYRSDWVLIVDLTLELGTQKALVVLGVSQQHLLEQVFPSRRGLGHQDVEILTLEIMHSTKGELVEQKLSEVSERVGRPVQIVADHGSDLKKGIKLYQQKHPEVIYTYDVTHGMALLLKHELAADQRYQSFWQKCNQLRQQLQQTELAFLSPPAQRSQCRYFNVEKLIDWARKLLDSPLETLVELMPTLELATLKQRLFDRLGWLIDYQEDLSLWGQMVNMTRTLETQLKLCGLNQQSLTIFEQQQFSVGVNSRLERFQQQILDYVATESSQIQKGQTLLASSDVIESLFGKYKQFSSRCPLKQMGKILLTIALSTMNLTAAIVKQALETVGSLELEEWSAQVFGQSMLSKRKTLFGSI